MRSWVPPPDTIYTALTHTQFRGKKKKSREYFNTEPFVINPKIDSQLLKMI